MRTSRAGKLKAPNSHLRCRPATQLARMLDTCAQRLVNIVVRCGMNVIGRQPILRQDHPATRCHAKCTAAARYTRTSEGKGSTVNPQHRAFCVLFPSHLRPSPVLELERLEFSTPRSRIQTRRHFDGMSNLLRCGLSHISTKHPRRVVGTFEPRSFCPPMLGEPYV